MMTGFRAWAIGLVLTILGGISPAIRAQVVPCTHAMRPPSDGALAVAVARLKANHPALAFAPMDACALARSTASAVNDEFHGPYVRRIKHYEGVEILNGRDAFSVEHFVFKDKRILPALEKVLAGHGTLGVIKGPLMRYDFFVEGEHLLMMIAPNREFERDQALFREIWRDFTAASRGR